MNTLQSMAISERIDEARAQLDEVEKKLAVLPGEKEQILSAEQLDKNAMKELNLRQLDLAQDKEFLQRRITLLSEQREEAEKQEAQARCDAIPEEAAALVEEARAITEACNKAAQVLLG